jgi:hypothetical protein
MSTALWRPSDNAHQTLSGPVHVRRRRCCGTAESMSIDHRSTLKFRCATLVTMTPCSASTSTAGPPDGHHQEHHCQRQLKTDPLAGQHLKIDPLGPVVCSFFGGSGCWDATEVAVFESVAVAFEGHQRNAKLQLTVLLAPPEPVPGLLIHPDHRRRLRRPAVRSEL